MLTHLGTVRLKTERLILRPFTVDDAEDMYRNWASDPEVTRYLTWQPHESREVTEDILAAWCALYEDPAIYNWAIELCAAGQAIGNISVVDRSDRHEYCEIGYSLSRLYWRQGIMTEAARAVVSFLLRDVGFHRVQAYHHADNPASGRVMQHCGMIYEGTRRGCYRMADGSFADLCYYGITQELYDGKGETCAWL